MLVLPHVQGRKELGLPGRFPTCSALELLQQVFESVLGGKVREVWARWRDPFYSYRVILLEVWRWMGRNSILQSP